MSRLNTRRLLRPFPFRRSLLAIVLLALFGSVPVVRTFEPELAAFDPVGLQARRGYFGQLPFDHVDMVNGNLLFTFTDLALPGNAGMDLRIVRTYNHQEPALKWRMGIAGVPILVAQPVEPVPPPEGTTWEPALVMADGTSHRLVAEAPGFLVTKDFWRYEISTRTLELPNGWKATYEGGNPSGGVMLVEVHDLFGNSITPDWEGGAPEDIRPLRLEGVTQSVGDAVDTGRSRTVTFGYGEPFNMMPASMTFDGRTWTYEHDFELPGTSAHLLTKVQPPAGPAWLFAYTVEGLEGTLEVTLPNGGKAAYDFNDQQLPAYEEVHRSVVGSLTVQPRTDEFPESAWSFTYAQPVGSNQATGTATGPGDRSLVFVQEPSATGTGIQGGWKLLTRTYREGSTDISILTRGYEFLPVSGPYGTEEISSETLEQDSKAYSTTYEYHSENFADYHRPWKITEASEPNGLTRITTREFDYDFDAGTHIKNKIKSESVGGFTTSYEYENATGFLIEQTTLGLLVTFGHDTWGNRASADDPRNPATNYTYRWGVVKFTDTPEYDIDRAINADGTVASETRNGDTTSFGYDDLGRLTSVAPPGVDATGTDYAGDGTSVTVSRGPSWTRTDLDGLGRPIGTETSAGVKTRIAYDVHGQKEYQSYPFGSTDQGDAFQYDALGRVTRVTHPDTTYVEYQHVSGELRIRDENNHWTTQYWATFGDPSDARLVQLKDANNRDWFYAYNALGSLTGVTSAGYARSWNYDATTNRLMSESHPESGATSYSYDGAGNLEVKDDSRPVHLVYGYDGNNRLTSTTAPVGGDSVTIGYDDADNRTSVTNGLVDTAFEYDGANRLTKRTDVISGKTFVTEYDYDGRNNLTQIVYPSGRIVDYLIDGGNRITRVDTHLGAESKTLANNVGYHPSGAVTGYALDNTTSDDVEFWPDRYWPKRLRTFKVGSSPLMDLTYMYEPVGNVSSIADAVTPNRDSTFGYDTLDRLTSVTSFGAIGYAYDDFGNRTWRGGTEFQYDAGTQRLTRDTSLPGTIGYDGAGNVTSDQSGFTYGYSSFSMQTSATLQSATTAYGYDGDNVRKRKSGASGTRLYVHGLGGQLLAEYADEGGPPRHLRDYVYLGTRLIASYSPDASGLAPQGAAPAPKNTKPQATPPPSVDFAAARERAIADIKAQLGKSGKDAGGVPQPPRGDPTFTPAIPAGLPVDLDGDGATDYAVVRKGAAPTYALTWHVLNSAGYSAIDFGVDGDVFVPADYDGDAKTDLAIWRTGTFWIRQSSNGAVVSQAWGQAGDNPTVVGDYDGDGKTDHAVYRAGATQGASSYFYIRRSTDGTMLSQSWGVHADQPSSGDFDGDGKSDFVVRRLTGSAGETTTYVLEADGGSQTIPFGWRSDVIVPGDYDTDGKTDLALVRATSGNITWYIRRSFDAQVVNLTWGSTTTGDVVVPGNYDADAVSDLAVWRPGNPATFYVFRMGPGSVWTQPWGVTGDYPPTNFIASAQGPSAGATMALTTPTNTQNVTRPFAVSGWAIDLAAGSSETGVDMVHIWATPEVGSSFFVGAATYGGSRPAVGQQYGAHFTNSGFDLTVTSGQMAAGVYTLLAIPHSTVSGAFDFDHAQAALVYVDMPAQTLTVTAGGTGRGTVTSDPAGISCTGPTNPAGTCEVAFAYGAQVNLTAQGELGTALGHWEGDCTQTTNPCVVQMTAAHNVTAVFQPGVPNGWIYYHTDALGSVRVVTNPAGDIVARHDYLPFGEDTAPLQGDPRRFTGKELDPETALTYFGARYYRNTWARFTGMDPVMDVQRSLVAPQRWNRYAYVANNPLRYIDPTGAEIELIGDESAREAAFELLKRVVGFEAGSRLFINAVTSGNTVRYFLAIRGDVGQFMSLGQTAHDLANLILHKQTVEFSLTSADLARAGGAAALEPGERGNTNARVLVNPKQIFLADRNLSPRTVWGYLKWGGQDANPAWIVMPFKPEIAAWHEFGHAWGVINGRSMPRTNAEAIDWENHARLQLYGPLGPKNAPRRIH